MSIKQDLYGVQVLENPAEKNSTFDILYWVFRILKYWYLFVIALIISIGLAYLKNQYWTPTYRTISTILIEEGKKSNDLVSGFYTGSGLRNINNQIIMYQSYDLVSKAIEQLGITNDVYLKTKFKKISCYKTAEIQIKESYIDGSAYSMEFEIQGLDENKYRISYLGDDHRAPFSIEGEYGKSIQHQLFFLTVNKTELYVNPQYQYNFSFYSKSGLISDYMSRLTCRFKDEKSSIMEVSVIGKVAERDKDFINALNEQFFVDNLERKNVAAEKSIDFIDKQLMIIKDSLDASEFKLNAYQTRSGLYGEGQSVRANMEFEELDRKRADLKYRQDYFKFLSDYLKKNTNNETLMTPVMMGIQDAQLTALVTEYNNLVFRQNEYGEGNPLWQKNKKQIDDVKARIAEILKTTPNSLAIEESSLNARYARVMNEMASLPERERKLLLHERDFKINDSYYTYLLQRRAESQIQMASNAPDNMLLDQPRVVQVVNSNDLSNTYWLFIIVGLFIPGIYILMREVLFKFTIQTRDEVEQMAGLPIVGTVETSDKDVDMVVKYYPKSGFTESFRSIRSKLEYLAKKEFPLSILVTSTEPGDGKTFIASNLSMVYQMTGKKVLMVDMDLRRPALSKQLLGADTHKGVSNYLIGQVTLDSVIVKHPDYGFDFLPAGTIPPNPSELIRSDKTKDMIDYLYGKYDYIVFDCSPFGLVSDASYIAKFVDLLLYVVRNEVTNRNFFKYTIKELKEEHVGAIGIIYNDVNLKSGQYVSKQYYGKSSYYHKRGSYYHEELMMDLSSHVNPENKTKTDK